jgi:hypothetical protein
VNGDIDTDYQKVAENSDWRGSDEKASYRYCLDRLPNEYPYEVGIGTISILNGGKTVYLFKAYLRTVFTCSEGTLYLANLDCTTSGCEIVAYDLKARKERWKTRLKGVGAVEGTSKYRNWVNIEIDGKAVTVWGNESAGRYVEILEAKTGKMVGHKVFRR